MSDSACVIVPFGEAGWLVRLKGRDMISTALSANTIAESLRRKPGVTDCVAGIDTVALRFDPARLSVEDARQSLEKAVSTAPNAAHASRHRIEIPVCYGGEHGPDLSMLAKQLSLSEADIIRLHSDQKYRVLTIGFAPGFAYLGPLPEALQTSRLNSPRAHVPAGSVGIAAAMTGIYPLASPGGWPLIGRTPKRLFDAASETPFQFSAGDEVIFTPITTDAFTALEAPRS